MKERTHTSERQHCAFQVGSEYDTQQLAFARYKSQMFEDKLKNLETEILNQKLEEGDIHHICDRVKDEFKRAITTEKHFLEHKSSKLLAWQNIMNEDLIKNHYLDRRDFEQNKRQSVLDKKFRNLIKYQSRFTDIEDEVKILQERRNAYKNPPPVRSVLNRAVPYFICIGSFALGDAILSFNAMQVLGEGIANLSLMWLTGLTAIGVAIGAHFTGAALAKEGARKSFFASFLISALFVTILVWLRLDVKSSIILSFFNIAFYAIASLISYKRYLHNEYWSVCSRLYRLKQKKRTLQVRIQYQGGVLQADTKAIDIMLRNWAKEQAAKDIAHNKITSVSLENALSGMDKILGGFYGRVELIRKNAIAKAVKRNEVKERRSFRVPDLGLSSALRSLFTLSVLLVLGACSNTVQRTDSVVLFDLTESRAVSPTIENVINDIGAIQAGQVTLSVISDVHGYPYRTITLPAPKAYFEQIKEEEDQRLSDFTLELREAYDALPLPITEPQQSLVFSALAKHLKTLSRSSADKRQLILYSDMLQFEKRGVNFYRYRAHPKNLLSHYDDIVLAFSSEYDPNTELDLSGIDITIYHTPAQKNDALWRFVEVFYTKFFTDYGADTIRFLPYLKHGGHDLARSY